MLDKPFRLDGEYAVITGGGTGLGLAIAQCLVSCGAEVCLIGRRPEPLREAVSALGDSASALPLDICDAEAPETLEAFLQERGKSATILVNNAGIHLKKPATETSLDEFKSVLDTHVNAAFALTHLVLPDMYKRQHGSILYMGSMASLFGIPNVMAYSAAKSAYLGMIRGLAVEAGPYGVRVNGIAPGWIETPMLSKALEGDPERKQKILGRTPMEAFGKPEDIGWACAYLCSPAARFVTGVMLPVDGGGSIGF